MFMLSPQVAKCRHILCLIKLNENPVAVHDHHTFRRTVRSTDKWMKYDNNVFTHQFHLLFIKVLHKTFHLICHLTGKKKNHLQFKQNLKFCLC